MNADPPDQEEYTEGEEAGGIGAGELLGFAAAAFRRHVLLAVIVGVCVAALGVTVALVMPPVYEASGKLRVDQSGGNTMRNISNPGVGAGNPDPLADAPDVILSKSNLLQLVRAAKLRDQWDATRGAKGRLIDWFRSKLNGPTSNEDKETALAGMLEQQLMVIPDGRYKMSVRIYWGEPLMASKLVEVALRQFLDRKLVDETAVIRTAVDILDKELRKTTDDIGPALEAVRHATLALRNSNAPPPAAEKAEVRAVRSAPAPAPEVKPAVDPALATRLAEVRQEITAIQEPWQRRLQDLRTQLQDLRGIYGPEHPTVVQQVNRVQEGSVEPPELVQLREEERRLSAQLRDAATPAAGAGTASQTVYRRTASGETVSIPLAAPATESPELTSARSRLTAQLDNYNEVKARLNAAHLELSSAEQAFNLRYKILDKPEPPRKPLKPNRPLLVAASLAVALLVGFLAGGIKELLSGRFVDVWQVRQLGLPLLAEVAPPEEPEA